MGKVNKKQLKKKQKLPEESPSDKENQVDLPPATRKSDDPINKKSKWVNRQRLLIFSARGITFRHRHLMMDLRTLLPHHKPDNKRDRKEPVRFINELCEMKHANACMYFEGRKKQDLFMWLSNVPNGPSIKFLVQNIHTLEELNMTGNCLKGSRAILSFSEEFESVPHYQLLKELLSQIFTTPYHHPKSQPFVDHCITFTVIDNRIWFRNYQIMEETGSLVEIGPRFVLNPIKMFEGSFGGETLWENPHYVTPNTVRSLLKQKDMGKYLNKIEAQKSREHRVPEVSYNVDETEDVFKT